MPRQKSKWGFSGSARATEPQAPEGKAVFALNLFKASAAPEGSKEQKKIYMEE